MLSEESKLHPNVFLKTFWRTELKHQIFVAMSFADAYKSRFNNIIKPVIESIKIDGVGLSAYRVDLSKTGDSILTDIMEGVAHSRMVLADVSTVGKDAATGLPFRNGNVMYEVGLALACRQSSEVLLVRDDADTFLFDVSTIPHMRINFTDTDSAKQRLRSELVDRLREQQFVNDARIRLALSHLSEWEIKLLMQFDETIPGQSRGWDIGGTVLSVHENAITRLLDKQLIMLVGKFPKGFPAYDLTPLGSVVASLAKNNLPELAVTGSTPDER
jgi:hypothetical protein